MIRRKVRSLIVRIIRTIYPSFGLREGDIVVGSFPKSGSTWLRFMLANVVRLVELGWEEPVDYHMLNGPMACEFDPGRRPSLGFETIPPYMKTHHFYSEGAFGAHSRIALIRHPGDVMVSFYEYKRHSLGSEHFQGTFSEFLRHGDFGLRAWRKHTSGWVDHADLVISYEGMKADGVAILSKVLSVGGIQLGNNVLSKAVEASSFSRIRRMEIEKGVDERAKKRLSSGFRFARSGETGQWQERFSERDLEYARTILRDSSIYQF